MTTKPRYPLVRDAPSGSRTANLHCEIDVTWAEGQEPQRFCGDNWCTGGCELPALVMDCSPEPEYQRIRKASGSQVACGAMMQDLRVDWAGPRVEVPAEYRDDFPERMWW